MNSRVLHNFSKVTLPWLLLPLILLLGLFVFLLGNNALSIKQYIEIQKESFYALNQVLGQAPLLQLNITQMGDALIFLSFLSVFFVRTPVLWGALINASLISLIITPLLKKILAVPRPAAFLNPETFTIVDRVLTGYNSLPSGHSITVFTLLTVLVVAFWPKTNPKKFVWSFVFLTIGFLVALSRVGVGAHYPLDVVSGAIIGLFCGLLGIIIQQKLQLWNWIGDRKFYPIFAALFAISLVVIVSKILHNNLIVFYLAIACLTLSFVNTIYAYVKK